jgi:hypothetical protein
MIDSNAVFRKWHLQSATVAELAGDRVYCPMFPEGYDPGVNGIALTFNTRGGTADLDVPLITPSFQVRAWAPASEPRRARELYRAVFDLVHGAMAVDLGADGYILWAREQVQGQDLTDPDTGWATVLAYFEAMMRAA